MKHTIITVCVSVGLWGITACGGDDTVPPLEAAGGNDGSATDQAGTGPAASGTDGDTANGSSDGLTTGASSGSDSTSDGSSLSTVDEPKQCVDQDGDGWCVPFDCDDTRSDVNPGRLETEATPYDDNCNGKTDDIRPESVQTELAYIWIANSAENTVSKVNTRTLIEEARYRTCPDADCDPSRTSVNLHGDVVVTNRFYGASTHGSSVIKIASFQKDCVDRNGNGKIDTSTGPGNVLGWNGDTPMDECILWYTPLPNINGQFPRARATAWDGSEDPETGEGGLVVIGSCLGGAADEFNEWAKKTGNTVFFLDGDDGTIVNQYQFTELTECFYGAAMDAVGNYWIMDGFGFPNNQNGGALIKVPVADPASFTRYRGECGYGITADPKGNIWTAGKDMSSPSVPNHRSCVQRFSSTSLASARSDLISGVHLRGIAYGAGVSEGYVWAAESLGHLYRFDEDTLEMKVYETPVVQENPSLQCRTASNSCDNGLVGIAVDWDGYVWMVSTTQNAAYRFDPINETFDKIPIGTKPYTYSDMTGMQLRNVVNVN